jgi:DNA (cytosine-5)-methyltransferase 1
MRVLNAYAGIGGNRHLWPEHWQVTAVEWDERIAAEYARRYPDDVVIVADAHACVMEHAHEFDAVWTSPPCPTHSRFNHSVKGMKNREVKPPDPRLWAEIAHLRDSGVRYVVENVHTYYEPPIQPDVVTLRHYYWVSSAPLLMSHPYTGTAISNNTTKSVDETALSYGLPIIPKGAVKNPRLAIRNAVVPTEGLEIAAGAFA